ncbi:Phosphoglycerate mutase 2 [Frankliniella fusca]|uniref:Phosphoglycerate mutase 2 n=1 Tax=Frankliniella fusca TaxID=407009 RepID=A0AAE1HMS8_9NEOP|nr:Phosphoglycerate mutase 2 [Frankliniella fusca]
MSADALRLNQTALRLGRLLLLHRGGIVGANLAGVAQEASRKHVKCAKKSFDIFAKGATKLRVFGTSQGVR